MTQSITKGERKLINILLEESKPVNINYLRGELNKSKRMIYYYIDNVNIVFHSSNVGKINVNESGYYLTEEQKRKIANLITSTSIILTPNERLAYIICYLIFSNEKITLDVLVDNFHVSKNTILSDLLEVREQLLPYQLILDNNKQDGYIIEGDVFRKRNAFQTNLRILLNSIEYNNIELLNIELVEDYFSRLNLCLESLNIELYENEVISLSFLLATTKINPTPYNDNLIDLDFFADSAELNKVDIYFPDLPHHERIYLAIQLLSYSNSREKTLLDNDLYLLDLSSELINTFELLSCLRFSEKEKLINSVYLHLQLSNFQYHYALPSANPLMKDIKDKYADIFNITKLCCKKLENKFPYPVLESEISFLTIHFAAYLSKEHLITENAKVILVCLNTTTGSLLLKNEIHNSFENIEIIDIVKPSELIKYDMSSYDFVISTIKFETDNPIIFVNPILTMKDKITINSMLVKLSKGKGVDFQMQQIYNVIKDVVSDEELYYKIITELENHNDKSNYEYIDSSNKNSLLDMVNEFGIQFDNEYRLDWENVVREGSKPLVEHEYIEPRYVQRMINLVMQYGPYIVLSEDIAIAHAQPEDGVNKLGLTLKVFPNKMMIKGKETSLFFVLATSNQEEHLKILNDIFRLSSNQVVINRIKSAADEKEAILLLSEFLGKK